MKVIKIISLLGVICLITFYIYARAFFGNKQEVRPKLDPNSIVLINGVQSPDSKLIIQEINSLRDKKWSKFDGKMSDTGTTLQIKNDPKGIRFSLSASHIEESQRDSNLSGGYMCGIQIKNLPNIEKILKKKK